MWYAEAEVDPANLEPAVEAVRTELQRLRQAPPEHGDPAGRPGAGVSSSPTAC
jgi:hypothetical protein